jgi:hypothetical protein
MNKQVIIPRRSNDEVTFAVVRYAGCEPDQLLHRLRRAVEMWARTEQGRAALAEAPRDFNVGDLSQFTPAGMGREDDLSLSLLAVGVTHLDIDVHSQDGVVRGWDYDTPLV